MANQPASGGAGGKKANRAWYLLLLPSFVGVLWVPFFNKLEPSWAGIPFFYWYQFLWVFISAVLTLVVYYKTK